MKEKSSFISGLKPFRYFISFLFHPFFLTPLKPFEDVSTNQVHLANVHSYFNFCCAIHNFKVQSTLFSIMIIFALLLSSGQIIQFWHRDLIKTFSYTQCFPPYLISFSLVFERTSESVERLRLSIVTLAISINVITHPQISKIKYATQLLSPAFNSNQIN